MVLLKQFPGRYLRFLSILGLLLTIINGWQGGLLATFTKIIQLKQTNVPIDNEVINLWKNGRQLM